MTSEFKRWLLPKEETKMSLWVIIEERNLDARRWASLDDGMLLLPVFAKIQPSCSLEELFKVQEFRLEIRQVAYFTMVSKAMNWVGWWTTSCYKEEYKRINFFSWRSTSYKNIPCLLENPSKENRLSLSQERVPYTATLLCIWLLGGIIYFVAP